MTIRGFLVAAALSSACNTLLAQDQWSLQQCLDYAMANNIELKQGELSIEESEASLSQGKGNLFPSLSFSTNHSLNWRPWSQSTVNLSGGTLTQTQSDVSYNGSYSLSAQWTIWDGGKKYKNVDVYELNTEQSRLQQVQTANSIEEQIMQYYVQILYQTEAVVVADSTLSTAILQRDRARAMVEAGKMAKVELAQLEAQVAQDEYSLVSNQTALANYKLQLKQILELPAGQDFDVATPDVADDKVLEPIPDKDEIYQQALASRPEVKLSQLSIQQADLQEDLARRGFYPTLSMSAGVQTSHSSMSDDGVGAQLKKNVNNSLGLSLSIPILDGRSNRTNKAKAKIQKQESELSLLNSQKDVYKQVESYWLNATSAQRQYIAAKANVQSSADSYDLVSEQFRLGLKNIAELTTGKNNLMQAQQQLLQCKYTALMDIAMLRFYAGQGLNL